MSGTEQKRLRRNEWRARAANVGNREGEERLPTAEMERLRLALDLHDGVVQTLLGLRYQLAAGAERRASGGPESDLLSTVLSVERGLAGVVGELRELIGELRQPRIGPWELRQALECCLANLPTEPASTVRLAVSERVCYLPRSTTLCLAQAAQELLRNAVVHAEAKQVTIRIRVQPNWVVLRVRDDGRGFEVPERLETLARRGHFGLCGVADRVTWAHGRLRIRSRPGRGTEVVVCLPLVGIEEVGRTNDGTHSGSAR